MREVVEGLDQNDQTQVEASAMLQTFIAGFPMKRWRRL
jgi:hypothetical protein